MASKDLHNNINKVVALNQTTITTDTTTNGNIIDLQGYGACEFLIMAGTITDGDYLPLIQEGDESNLSDAAAVADADLLGTEAGAQFVTNTDDNQVSSIGYVGNKRYVRLNLVSTNTATNGATFTGIALRGYPEDAPVTNATP